MNSSGNRGETDPIDMKTSSDLPGDPQHLTAAGPTAAPNRPAELSSWARLALDALAEGTHRRTGPVPADGPQAVAERVRAGCAPVLPETGIGPEAALHTLIRAVAEGSADPADPRCAAHLHCSPLAIAVAADLAASALNPSMDSWDQALAAGVVEQDTAAALAALVYPDAPDPDALITSGATESNLVALLLARERARAAAAPPLRVICGSNAHHSVRRAAWLLGLPEPLVLRSRAGRLDPAAVHQVLSGASTSQPPVPTLVVATAGTTNEGLIDPLPELADVATQHGARLHIDAAYGGPLLFSDRLKHRLDGVTSAVTVAFDLHKLGWQPISAGVLAVREAASLRPLSLRADYLNADDDTDAGLPDLLGRSIRTSRRPDVLKIAVTLRALGRSGLGALIEACVNTAEGFAGLIDQHPALRRRPGDIGISTVLFRPTIADELPHPAGDHLVAAIRRELLSAGSAVLGRARAEDFDGTERLWLKATLLHPDASARDFAPLLTLVADHAADLARTEEGPR